MTWRSSDLIERLGIRICFSGGIGDGSDAGGFGGDAGGFGGDAGGYGGDSGGLGSDMGGDVSGDMGGDFGGDSSADSYGGDAGLGSDGYGSDMGAASDGYGADASESSYEGDMGMDAGEAEADVGLGSESEDGLGGYNDGGGYGLGVATGTGDLGVDTGSLDSADALGGSSAEADDGALAGEAAVTSATDGDLGPTSEMDDGLAAGSLETSDLSSAAFGGPVQEGWSETGDITTAGLDPAGAVASYTPDTDLGFTEYDAEPNFAAASYNTGIVTDPLLGVTEATMQNGVVGSPVVTDIGFHPDEQVDLVAIPAVDAFSAAQLGNLTVDEEAYVQLAQASQPLLLI